MRTRLLGAAMAIVAACPLFLRASQGDTDVARAVGDALRQCPHYTIFDDVAVSVGDRAITLTGEVTSAQKRTAIAEAIGRTAGARRVINEILVLPSSPRDADLRQRAAHALYSHAAFWHYASMPAPPIHIVVRDGHVRLTGAVATEVERALAQSVVAVPGVASVRNELNVARRPTRPPDPRV